MATFKRLFILVGLLTLTSGNQILAQVGKEFWFVALDVTKDHGANGPYAIRITARDKDANVTLSLLGGAQSKTVLVKANTQYSFKTDDVAGDPNYWNQFNMTNLENSGLNTVNNKGIHITSDNDVSAYFEDYSGVNPDIFTLKGESALGMEFYVPSQDSYKNSPNPTPTLPYEEINIVATEVGNTQVVIVPTADLFGPSGTTLNAGDTIKVTLAQGQTYSIRSNSQVNTITLGGTYIKSDKNIAVTVSDDSVKPGSGAYDLIGDQIVPTSVIGKEYVAIKATPGSSDISKLYITATADGTVIYKDENADPKVLNKGDLLALDFSSSSNSCYIRATEPIYLYQVSGFGGELGSALLPPITGCTGSQRVSFTRNFANQYWVQIAVQKQYLDLKPFKMYNDNNVEVLPGAINGLTWTYVAYTGSTKNANDIDAWYTASANMQVAPFLITANGIETGKSYSIEITKGQFHLSVLDQNGASMSFGYFSAYNAVTITPVDQQCVGNAVVLTSRSTNGTYLWSNNINSNTSTGPTLTVTQGGQYYLTRTDLGCTATDTLDVVFKQPSFTLTQPGKVCPDENVIIKATPTDPASIYTYTWKVDNVVTAAAPPDQLTLLLASGQTKNVSVTADEGGCTTAITEAVVAYSSVKADLTLAPSTLCVGDTIRNNGLLDTYTWTAPNGTVTTGKQSYIIATQTGLYKLEGKSIEGCITTDSKNITVNTLPVVKIDGKALCYGASATYVAATATSGAKLPITQQWVSSTSTITTPSYTITPSTIPAGIVWLRVKDANGCSAIDTAIVSWSTETKVALNYTSASQPISIDASTVINTCAENTVTLTAAGSGSTGVKSYQWSIGGVVQANTTNTLIVPVAAGTSKNVTIVITDNNNCTATDAVTITAYASPVIYISKGTICLGESFSAYVNPSLVPPTVIANYNWYNNVPALMHTGSTYTPIVAGNYSVGAISNNGCISNTLPLTVNDLPTAIVVLGTPACPKTDFLFDGSSSIGASSYKWDQSGVPLEPKSYTLSTFGVKAVAPVSLEVTNAFGCKHKVSGFMPSWKTEHTVDIGYTTNAGTPSNVSPALFCPGSPVTLTSTVLPADGATITYSWKIGAAQVGTNSTYSFNAPAANASITVTLDITYNGCDASKSIVVKGYPDPNALLTSQEVCLNSTLELSKSVDPTKIISFTWSYGGIPQIADGFKNITPALGGDYTLSIVDLNGCSASVVDKVNDPALAIKNAKKVAACAPQQHTFEIDNPKATYTYSWQPVVGASTLGISYTAVDSGVYKVTAVYNNPLACWDTTSVQLKWPAKKMLDIADTLHVCSTGLPYFINGDPTFSNYTWARQVIPGPGNPLVLTSETSSSYEVLPTIDGVYAFRVEADYTFPDFPGTTCHIIQDFKLEVLPVMPALSFNKDLICDPSPLSKTVCLCEGESVKFSTSTSVGYTSFTWTYSPDPATIPPVFKGNTATIIADLDGVYHLDAMQSNGCLAVGDVIVAVTPMPEIDLSSTQVCTGTPIVITNDDDPAPISYDYKWVYNNIDIGNNNLSLSTSNTGIYTVTASSKLPNTRCKVTDKITISYPTKPSVTLADNAICSSSTFDLSTQFNGVINPGTLVSQNWSFGGAPVLAPYLVNTKGTYNLNLVVNTNLGFNCPFTYPLFLNVVQEPLFSIADATICEGLNATLNATVTSGSYSSLLWNYYGNNPVGPIVIPSDPYSPTQNFPATTSILVEEAGYYKVRGTVTGIRPPNTIFSCSSLSSPIKLTINPNPIVTVEPTPDPLNFYICDKSFSDVKASSPTVASTNYLWSNGVAGVNQITVNKGGYYEAVGTDANGCKGKDGTTMVNYVKTPVVLPVIQPTCANIPVILPIIPGVQAFQWYFTNVGNADTGGLNQPMTAKTTGKYVLSYQYEPNGCWIDTSLVVSLLPMPVINVTTPSKEFCDGESFLLDPNISGNYSYEWTRTPISGGASQLVSSSKTYEAKISGDYTLIATENGCSSTSTTRVVVNPNPTIILGPDFSYCKDVPFTLSVQNPTGLSGYIWSTGATDNGKSSIVADNDGIYTVTAFNAFNCSNDTSIVATSYPTQSLAKLPVIETVCDNGTFTLTSPLLVPSEINTYQWFYNSLTSGIQGAINTPWTRSGLQGGNYIYQVQDLNGCYNSQLMPLEVLPSPTVSLPTIGCFADTLLVEPKNSYISYLWNGNPANNKNYILVDQLGSKLYTVEVVDQNGCITNASTNFAAFPLPNPSLGPDIEKCSGLFTTLQPSGGPYTSILWSTGDKTPSIYVNHGKYWARVTDANGCKNTTATINIDWLPLPFPYLGTDTTICPADQLILNAGVDSVGASYASYEWHTGATNQTNLANRVDTVNFVKVIDNKGCIGWDEKLVYNLVTPKYAIPSDTVCDNTTHTLDGSDGGLYPIVRWRYGVTDTITPTLEVSNPGDTYFVDATDGCFNVSDTVTIGFWETPVITSIDTMIYARLTVYADKGKQPYMYTLNQGNLQPSNVFYLDGNGTYETYVQDQNGCWAKDTVVINSVLDIDIPKFFTPNEDGYNDRWKIDGLQERFPDAMLSIYDRYGRFLVKFRGDAEGWDGTYLNQPMPSDDYWFYLDLVQIKKTIKGNLTLKR